MDIIWIDLIWCVRSERERAMKTSSDNGRQNYSYRRRAISLTLLDGVMDSDSGGEGRWEKCTRDSKQPSEWKEWANGKQSSHPDVVQRASLSILTAGGAVIRPIVCCSMVCTARSPISIDGKLLLPLGIGPLTPGLLWWAVTIATLGWNLLSGTLF